jgi:hypothetical protein
MNGFADRIADYLDGSMDDDARDRFESELLQDESLAMTVYRELGVRDAQGEPAPTRADVSVPRASRGGARAWFGWLVPVAALAVAFAIWLRPGTPTDPGAPDVARGSEVAVMLIAPDLRAASTPTMFTWATVAGANAYRLEVFDAASDVVLHTIVGDTTWSGVEALPAALDGTWRVVALRDGREVDRSSLRALRYP